MLNLALFIALEIPAASMGLIFPSGRLWAGRQAGQENHSPRLTSAITGSNSGDAIADVDRPVRTSTLHGLFAIAAGTTKQARSWEILP